MGKRWYKLARRLKLQIDNFSTDVLYKADQPFVQVLNQVVKQENVHAA